MLFQKKKVESFNHFRFWIGRGSIGLIIICLTTVLLASILYINSLGNQFTNWDDSMIYANPEIRSLGWENILKIFTLKKGSTYQPIRVLSYAIDYYFWGLNPVGYHITNILFYVLTCIMIYFTSFYVSMHLREKASPDSHGRVAFFGALLFTAHPVHVEAVTWLAARKEVLQGSFFFLGFFLYLKAREETRRRTFYLSLVVFSFLLAILSKNSAVVFPGVIIIYEISRKNESLVGFFKRHWFFLASSLIISAVFTFILLRVMVEAEGIKAYRGDSIPSSLLIYIYTFLQNIKLLSFTINYSAGYSFFLSLPIFSLTNILLVLMTLCLPGISVYSLRKSKVIFFLFFFFLVTLLPYLNIIPISTVKADRYVFIASFSYALLMGIVFDRFYVYQNKRFPKGFFKIASLGLLLLLLGGYSFITVRQNEVWENSYTLWSDAVKKHPGSNLANAKMGEVYLKAGLFQKSAESLEKAIELLPWDYVSRNNLGIAYAKLGEPEKASKEFMTAISLEPEEAMAHINLSAFYQEQKEYKKAEEILKYLLSKNLQIADLHYRLGFVYKDVGKYEEAIVEFIRSVEIDPNLTNAYMEVGNIYAYKVGNMNKARYYFSRGIEAASKAKLRNENLR